MIQPAALTPAVETPTQAPPSWRGAHRAGLVMSDLLAATAAAFLTVLLRYDAQPAELSGIDYRVLALLFVPVWLATLAITGGYQRTVLGVGTEEFRRVLDAGVRTLAGIAVLVVALKVDVARSVVGAVLPCAVLLTLLGRWSLRRILHRLRRRDEWCHRVLVVGSDRDCASLMNSLNRHGEAGLRVVAACGAGPGTGLGVPVVGGLSDVADAAARVGADTVAVAAPGDLGDEGMRRLAWSLEGRDVDLLVAPGLTYVAVPRIVVRPVDGSPLLHVEEPTLAGPRRVLKDVFDRTVALLSLLVLALPLLVLALLVRLTSPGAAFFKQVRVGKDGREFRLWKLRTMVGGAESMIPAGNDADGLLFKLREDPRVTPIGRLLRRWSLDELPQLLNVVMGSMSLVGPRPPLPLEVSGYGDDVRRRLLVKPGLTGLWQVSGRSDLPWDEAVRLDLQYVENWSIALDVVIVLRTAAAVLRRRGAY